MDVDLTPMTHTIILKIIIENNHIRYFEIYRIINYQNPSNEILNSENNILKIDSDFQNETEIIY